MYTARFSLFNVSVTELSLALRASTIYGLAEADSHVNEGLETLSLAAPDPKKCVWGNCVQKVELWNVYWMTFYLLRKCTVYVTTSIQPDPLTASPN